MGEVVQIDSKGRIVIPSSVRSKFELEEETPLLVEIRGDEIVLSRLVTEAEQARSESDSL
jgi:AbrB family looped-hinge helix DNA binding protein